MIRKKLIAFILILLAFLMQTTIFRVIALAEVVPNLLLVVTISYAYLRGRTSGIVIGFVCGIMLDMMYGSVMGLYAFVFMTIGFMIGFCQKLYFTDSILLPTILIAVSDLLYCFYCYITEFLMRGRLHFIFYFVHKFLPEILYTTLVGFVLYQLIVWMEGKLTRSREEVSHV